MPDVWQTIKFNIRRKEMFKKLFKLFKKSKDLDICVNCKNVFPINEMKLYNYVNFVERYVCMKCQAEILLNKAKESYKKPLAEVLPKLEESKHIKYKETYTKNEVQILSKMYLNGQSFKEIAENIGRTPSGVASKIQRMRAVYGNEDRVEKFTNNKMRVWYAREEFLLKDLYKQGKSFAEIAVILGRTQSSVRNKAERLGVYICKNTQAIT